MGCIIGTVVSAVACCFCNVAASLCCACLPSCKGSTSSRLMYLLMMTLGFVLAAIMLSEIPAHWLQSVANLCKSINETTLNRYTNYDVHCNYTVQLSAIYRCSFGITIFFFIMSLLMIRVRSSSEVRGQIHNGFWGIKFIVFFTLITLSLILLPEPYFTSSWLIFGMIGAFLFILIQLILIVDFSYAWNDLWLNKYEIENSKNYYYGLVASTLVLYACSIAVAALLVVTFAWKSTCHMNRFFIILNIVMCIACLVVSVTNKVQEFNKRSGLLQSSCITLYVMFLTWGSLRDSPDKLCNLSLDVMIIHQNKSRINELLRGNRSDSGKIMLSQFENYKLDWNIYLFMTLFIYYFLVIYFSIRASEDNNTVDVVLITEPTVLPEPEEVKPVQDQGGRWKYIGQEVIDDEKTNVSYDYSLFHFLNCLGATYIQMSLTNWYSLYSSTMVLKVNPASMWVKMVSSWVCIILYLWTLLAPVFFPDRDFN